MLKRLSTLIEPSTKLLQTQNSQWICVFPNHVRQVAPFSTVPSTEDVQTKSNVSKAMKAYLDRAQEHDDFMKQQNLEYQIGKRHLANMMGENPETFTQEDVDHAIEYLFPSGLYERTARPMMKPPEEIYPRRKAAEFDESGRPYHFLFYTARPNFFKLLHDSVSNMKELIKFEDAMIRKGNTPDPNLTLNMSGYQWLDRDSLAKELVEVIGDKDYETFVATMDRLLEMPYSYRVQDFIFKYRKPLMSQTKTYDAPKPQYDENGRAFITTYECLRKRARGHVTLRVPGDGKITINGHGIDYFKEDQPREQVIFPLVFADMLTKVDVEAEVEGGGPSGQAGAIRWGIAWGLRSFLDQEAIEKMRLAGLLTRDYRTRERKKPGQAGARKKFTWKKR